MTNADSLPSWPKAYPDFEELDSLLRCGICYDYINTALMTPCSHNFCSICIRKYMLYKTNCPACFADTVDSQLKFNRTLDNIIVILKRLKTPLCQALKENIPSNNQANKSVAPSNSLVTQTNSPSVEASTPKIEAHSSKPQKTKFSPKVPIHTKSPSTSNFVTSSNSSFAEISCLTPSTQRMQSILESDVPSSPNHQSSSSSKCPTLTGRSSDTQKNAPRSVMQMLMSPGKKAGSSSAPASPSHNSQAATVSSVPKVPCPVCNVDIPESYINQHLDKCLKNAVPAPVKKKTEKSVCGRRPLPKLVYHCLSEKELKRKLSDFNLSTQGDRKTLEKRHQRYTLLYNSECDKELEEQRPVPQLVRQVEREERDEGRGNHRTLNTLQVDRKTDPKVIEEAQKKYLSDNKSSFDALVADLKRRQAKIRANKSSTPSSAGPSTSTTSSVSPIPEEPANQHEVRTKKKSSAASQSGPSLISSISPIPEEPSPQHEVRTKKKSSAPSQSDPSLISSVSPIPEEPANHHEVRTKKKSSAPSQSSPSLISSVSPIPEEPANQHEVRTKKKSSAPSQSSPSLISGPVSPKPSKSPLLITEDSSSSCETNYLLNIFESSFENPEPVIKSPILGKRRLFENHEQQQVAGKQPSIHFSDDSDSDATVFSEDDFAQIDALTQQSQVIPEATPPQAACVNTTPKYSKAKTSLSQDSPPITSGKKVCVSSAMKQIKSLSQQSVGKVSPCEAAPRNIVPHSLNDEDSTDSESMFHVPVKSKTPIKTKYQVAKKTAGKESRGRAKKREIANDSEPRRSSRKKARH